MTNHRSPRSTTPWRDALGPGYATGLSSAMAAYLADHPLPVPGARSAPRRRRGNARPDAPLLRPRVRRSAVAGHPVVAPC